MPVPVRQGQWAEQITVQRNALDAARRLGDRPGPFPSTGETYTHTTGPATATYIKADLAAVATALAAMTGQPHPMANPRRPSKPRRYAQPVRR